MAGVAGLVPVVAAVLVLISQGVGLKCPQAATRIADVRYTVER